MDAIVSARLEEAGQFAKAERSFSTGHEVDFHVHRLAHAIEKLCEVCRDLDSDNQTLRAEVEALRNASLPLLKLYHGEWVKL